MISDVRVIAGFRPSASALCAANGEQPYSIRPGRTQSACVSGNLRSAAEFASERGASNGWVILAEPIELWRNPAAFGIGKVRHQRDRADLRVLLERVPRDAHIVHREAQPVHSAVHLEIGVDRALERRLPQDLDLLEVVDHRRKLVARDERQVFGSEEPFQHQDRLGDACVAQLQRLGEVQHRITVGGCERLRCAQQAMPIRVRLDHRPDLRIRRMLLRHA
jgi:hypothetical protein